MAYKELGMCYEISYFLSSALPIQTFSENLLAKTEVDFLANLTKNNQVFAINQELKPGLEAGFKHMIIRDRDLCFEN